MSNLEDKDIKIYFDNILQRIPGSIYWKDVNGTYLGCNQIQSNMAGFQSPEEMIGKTDYEMPWKEVADILKATDNNFTRIN